MTGIRRLFFLFIVLLLGIFLGTLGLKTALLIIVPIFLILLMSWDDSNYAYSKKNFHKQNTHQTRYH